MHWGIDCLMRFAFTQAFQTHPPSISTAFADTQLPVRGSFGIIRHVVPPRDNFPHHDRHGTVDSWSSPLKSLDELFFPCEYPLFNDNSHTDFNVTESWAGVSVNSPTRLYSFNPLRLSDRWFSIQWHIFRRKRLSPMRVFWFILRCFYFLPRIGALYCIFAKTLKPSLGYL